MSNRELEELALAVRKLAGLSEDELEFAPIMAGRILGNDSIALIPSLHGHGYLQDTGNGFRILVHPDRPDINFTIAHELGHWALRTIGQFRGEVVEEERAANYVGAAMLAPATTVMKAHAQWGERIRTMSKAFAISQTAMVLRLAEVRDDQRAVVTRTGNVLARGIAWTRVPVVEIARGRAQWKGLAKAEQLRGGIDEGRIALRAK